MRIPVIFVNGVLDAIRIEDLDDQLAKRLIFRFRRSSGWATVGRDELRSSRADGAGSWRDRKSNRRLLTM